MENVLPTRALTILCVDDNPEIGSSMGRWFGRLSAFKWVGWFGTVKEGEEAVRTIKPDIVLMDYDLPGEDPMATVAALSEEEPEVKVVVLSGHCRADYIDRALMSGAAGYLLKQDSPAEIAAAVQRAYEGSVVLSDAARQALGSRP